MFSILVKTKEIRKEPAIFANYLLTNKSFFRAFFFELKFFGLNLIMEDVHCKVYFILVYNFLFTFY